jgi:hypothetical protein
MHLTLHSSHWYGTTNETSPTPGPPRSRPHPKGVRSGPRHPRRPNRGTRGLGGDAASGGPWLVPRPRALPRGPRGSAHRAQVASPPHDLDRLAGAGAVGVAERGDLEPADLVAVVGVVAGAVPERDVPFQGSFLTWA